MFKALGRVAELADALDLGSSTARCAGSIPVSAIRASPWCAPMLPSAAFFSVFVGAVLLGALPFWPVRCTFRRTRQTLSLKPIAIIKVSAFLNPVVLHCQSRLANTHGGIQVELSYLSYLIKSQGFYRRTDVDYRHDGATLIVGKSKIQFEFPIRSLLSDNDRCYVTLQIPPDVSFPNNVYCVDDTGRVVWQIEKRINRPDTVYYDGVLKDDGNPEFYNYDGCHVKVNRDNGTVLDIRVTRMSM